VLGNAQAVIDGAVAAVALEARRFANFLCWTPVTLSMDSGELRLEGDESTPLLEGIDFATGTDESSFTNPSVTITCARLLMTRRWCRE